MHRYLYFEQATPLVARRATLWQVQVNHDSTAHTILCLTQAMQITRERETDHNNNNNSNDILFAFVLTAEYSQ